MIKRTSRIERLARKEERIVIKRIIFLSFFSLILAGFLFIFGIPLLAKLADFLDVLFKNEDKTASLEKNAPRPPRLDSLPTATNSAQIVISGFADEALKVEIFKNGENVGETVVKNGKFSFENLSLKDGQNEISAKSISELRLISDFSNSLTVVLDKEEPKLEIEGPDDNQSFLGNNRVRVFGKTDKDAQVFANDFLASIDIEGKFEVFVPVVEGETTIEIKAIDAAGNAKVEKRKISYRK